MVNGKWDDRDKARENPEREHDRKFPSCYAAGCLLALDDRKVTKMGDMYNRQNKKAARGIIIPAPWKEKKAAGAQGGDLVPYVASLKNAIFGQLGFIFGYFGLLNGA
jgi:hypothetical protein